MLDMVLNVALSPFIKNKTSPHPTQMYEENLADINSASATTDHIRLLRPSRRKHQWKGQLWTLKVFSLQTAPPFAALSYSWGDRLADAHISLDTGTTSVECPISTDLSSALTHLKKTNTLRWLWVDALCIDQASNLEKSHQVKIMRSIYTAADCVYVWLGEATVSVDPEQEFSKFSHMQQLALVAGINRAKVREWVQQGAQVWWQRLWTIQEVVSCETVFVCIGHHCTPWDQFWELLNEYTHRDAQTIGTIGIAYKAVVEANRQIFRMMKLRRDLRAKPNGESILELLRKTSPTGVSNPPDRIYSLLGVASSRDRASIPIKYGQSLAEIFTDLVMYFIASQRNLDILFEGWPRGAGDQSVEFEVSLNARHSTFRSAAVTSPQDKDLYSLPSWIPDFMKPPRTTRAPWLELYKYSASLDSRPNVKFQHRSLHMDALHFDVVYNVVPRHIFGMEEQEFRDLAAQFLIPAPDPYDLRSYDSRSSLVPHNDLRNILALIDPDIYKPTDWFCFSTKRGHIGLSLEKVDEGDQIVVPFGSSTPAILRRMNNGGGEKSAETFALVSDCYVDGLMYGELMTLHNDGKIEPYSYHLR